MNLQNETRDQKLVTAVFNGREKKVNKDFVTFEEIIALAFDNPPSGDGVDFTVQYTKGNSDKSKGTVLPGQTVKIKEGMEFDVTPTNRS